jgi:16S rRNA (cytidine1402-2'-O)-methyltransferase
VVVFESPHRLLVSLEDARAEFGNRRAAVARELTKLHEEVLRGTLSELTEKLGERPSLKGEFVLVIAGA